MHEREHGTSSPTAQRGDRLPARASRRRRTATGARRGPAGPRRRGCAPRRAPPAAHSHIAVATARPSTPGAARPRPSARRLLGAARASRARAPASAGAEAGERAGDRAETIATIPLVSSGNSGADRRPGGRVDQAGRAEHAQPQPGDRQRHGGDDQPADPGRDRHAPAARAEERVERGEQAGSSSAPTISRDAQSGSTLRSVTIPSGAFVEGGRVAPADGVQRADGAHAPRARRRAGACDRRSRRRPGRALRTAEIITAGSPSAPIGALLGQRHRQRAAHPLADGARATRVAAGLAPHGGLHGALEAERRRARRARPRHHPRLVDLGARHVAEHDHAVDRPARLFARPLAGALEPRARPGGRDEHERLVQVARLEDAASSSSTAVAESSALPGASRLASTTIRRARRARTRRDHRLQAVRGGGPVDRERGPLGLLARARPGPRRRSPRARRRRPSRACGPGTRPRARAATAARRRARCRMRARR